MKNRARNGSVALALLALMLTHTRSSTAFAFEGRITVTLTRGGESQTLLYTVGTNQLRIECGETNWPYPKDIVNLDIGDITLLFPHNRSFVRLRLAAENQSSAPPGFPGMPPPPSGFPPSGLPPGMGPQAGALPVAPAMPPPQNIGPTNLPGMPAMPQMPQMPPRPQMPAMPQLPPRPQMPPMAQMPPGVGPQGGSSVPNMPNMPAPPPGFAPRPGFGAPGMGMPMMPMMPMERLELNATADTTNLLGYTCTRYELRQHGEVMEIWATDKLPPFQPYLQNQPRRFGPRMIEDQWGELLKAKKLFPLLAVLRLEPPPGPAGAAPVPPGPERLRFEVKSITPEKIRDETLFEPPPDYQEIQPLPF